MTELQKKALIRKKILQNCNDDLEFRTKVEARCRKDVKFWIENFVWFYEPREKRTVMAVLYPFQRLFVDKLEECYGKYYL